MLLAERCSSIIQVATVSEKSGKNEIFSRSGKFWVLLKVREFISFWIFRRFSFTFIKHLKHLNKNLWKLLYVKHVQFSVQITAFKVSEILLKVREKFGKFFHSDVWQPWLILITTHMLDNLLHVWVLISSFDIWN